MIGYLVFFISASICGFFMLFTNCLKLLARVCLRNLFILGFKRLRISPNLAKDASDTAGTFCVG